jgi:hypothetical protein
MEETILRIEQDEGTRALRREVAAINATTSRGAVPAAAATTEPARTVIAAPRTIVAPPPKTPSPVSAPRKTVGPPPDTPSPVSKQSEDTIRLSYSAKISSHWITYKLEKSPDSAGNENKIAEEAVVL